MGVELWTAIVGRRTIKDFRPEPVGDEVLARALEAGIWAQNHRMTQPWRFLVLGPQTQRALAEAGAAAQVRGLPPEADEGTRAKVQAGAVQKLTSKPRIVVVTTVLSGDAFQRREDYAAVCCAIQNIQLAAWAAGLGMQWHSGKQTQAAETYQVLGIDPQAEEIAGFLFFGYPAAVPPAPARRPLAEVMQQLA
jgi:nitroreductase